MRTDNVRLAAFLVTKGHPVQGVEIGASGYGVLTFAEAAQADAETYEMGGNAPAEALLTNYRTLIRKIEEYKKRQGGAR
jgi:hypothetical protein